MPNIIQKLTSKIGLKLLQMGAAGRMTPRFNYEFGDDHQFAAILMSDYHYISHPVAASGTSQAYNLNVDYNLTAFDDKTLPNITLQKMIRLLKNNNALISQSLLNFRQFVTYDYRIDGTPRAKANIERVFKMLEQRRKPITLLLGQLAEGIYVGGGAYTEIVLAEDRMTTIDFVVNDPLTVKFQLIDDPIYGEDFRLIKIERNGKPASLNGIPTIKYIPVNGEVNSPFGKPFMLAAIFPAVWQLLLLKDIRDVLRTQVYPFVHVKVDLQKILEAAGGDTEKAKKDATTSRDTAINAWSKKGNNTAIATGDEVEYEIISGLNRSNMDIDPIISILNQQVASGAATMPLFLGINNATTEANADVQWLIEVAIIRSVQRELNALMTYNCNTINQAAGIGGEVVFSLMTMNAMERLREANIFQKEEEALAKLIDHLSAAFAAKTITMDEMVTQYNERKARIYLEN